jgi:hypothetical protein
VQLAIAAKIGVNKQNMVDRLDFELFMMDRSAVSPTNRLGEVKTVFTVVHDSLGLCDLLENEVQGKRQSHYFPRSLIRGVQRW